MPNRETTPVPSLEFWFDFGSNYSYLAMMRNRPQAVSARQRGVFGAPTFFIGDEMFWGNDRLEDAIAFAKGR